MRCRQPINAELVPYDLPAKGLECYAVRFDGFEGGRLAGWYIRPSLSGKFPGLCIYHGYSGRGTRLIDMIHLAAQGICVLSMDCRGQNGQSQDTAAVPEGHVPGWMTKGIRDARKYYYRYVYADAVRALEMLAKRDEVDASRLAIAGASQGGGLTLAVAALSPTADPGLPGHSLPLRLPPGDRDHAQRALSGDPDVSQILPAFVRGIDSHAELFRLHEPGAADQVQDADLQLSVG